MRGADESEEILGQKRGVYSLTIALVKSERKVVHARKTYKMREERVAKFVTRSTSALESQTTMDQERNSKISRATLKAS